MIGALSQSPVRDFNGKSGSIDTYTSKGGNDGAQAQVKQAPFSLLSEGTVFKPDQLDMSVESDPQTQLLPSFQPGQVIPNASQQEGLSPTMSVQSHPSNSNINRLTKDKTQGNLLSGNLSHLNQPSSIQSQLNSSKINTGLPFLERPEVQDEQLISHLDTPWDTGGEPKLDFDPQKVQFTMTGDSPAKSALNPFQMGTEPIVAQFNSSGVSPANEFQIGRKSNKVGLSGGDFLRTLEEVKSSEPRSGDITLKKGPDIGNLAVLETAQQKAPNDSESALDFSAFNSSNSKSDRKSSKSSQLDSLGSLDRLSHLGQEGNSIGKQTLEIPGHVVPGAMSKERLSTDSLMGMSTGIRNLASQGSGEMRVRLKPDNLGELNIRVMTQGNRIELQIQASDEKAKAVIEESLTHLKESLSAQHLTLSQVDLTLAGASIPTGSSDTSQDMNQKQFSMNDNRGFQDSLGQTGNQGLHHQNRQQGRSGYENGVDSGSDMRVKAGLVQTGKIQEGRMREADFRSTRHSSFGGRLDVRA